MIYTAADCHEILNQVAELPLAELLIEAETWEDFCHEADYDDIEAAIAYLSQKGFRIGLDILRPGA